MPCRWLGMMPAYIPQAMRTCATVAILRFLVWQFSFLRGFWAEFHRELLKQKMLLNNLCLAKYHFVHRPIFNTTKPTRWGQIQHVHGPISQKPVSTKICLA